MITRWAGCSLHPATGVFVLWINWLDIHRQDYPQLYPPLLHKVIQGLSTELPVCRMACGSTRKWAVMDALSATHKGYRVSVLFNSSYVDKYRPKG